MVKEKFDKHQKVSKYYESDCLQNFLFFFYVFINSSLKVVIRRLEFILSFQTTS